jgi:uncharacterized Zn finger protein
MNPNELNLNIRPEDLLDVKCDNCGGKYFEQVVQIKKISALQSPSGKTSYVPIPVFRCADCKAVNSEFEH